MNVVRERLANQGLTTPGLKTASDVVGRLGAVQAQDYAGAKWALSMRTAGATDAQIEGELTEGRILRTHVLRPTWHFVLPQDIRWMLALTGPRVTATMASYNRKLELTPAVFRRSHAVIEKALAGGKHLTRGELGVLLAKAKIGVTSGQRLGHLMGQAEVDAVICSGARRGKQFTYALLDERVAASPPRDRDEALLELTTRYFTTRGPASAHDFAWWSGLTVGDARRGIEMGGRGLTRILMDDRPHWFVPRDQPAPSEKRSAHLLPNYDEYFIGYKDRSSIGQRVRSLDLVTGGDALIAHIVFIDGQIVGGWKRVVERDTMIVALNLLLPLSAVEQKRVAAAAVRLSGFLGAPVKVTSSRNASAR